MMSTTRKGINMYVAIVLALLLVVGSLVTYSQLSTTATAETVKVSESATVVTSPFTEAVTKVKESVVGVNNYTNVSSRNSYYGFGFGSGSGSGRNEQDSDTTSREVLQSSGSGVVVATGYVLTNYHVVDGATSLEVTSGDNTYTATIAGSDQDLDLAVLKVDNLDIEPVTLGDSDLLNVGDWAICIGNPLSFTGTTTVGVISALNREVTSENYDVYGRRQDLKNYMIQTDAAINSGNSGGGMFNVAGELIGVPSIKYTGSYYSRASVEGIGMAIPINAAKTLINDVLSGKVTEEASVESGADTSIGAAKPRIGVTVANAGDYFSLPVQQGVLPKGAYVTGVEADSPAAKAGIATGDIIVEADGTVVSGTSQLIEVLQSKNAGDQVTVKFYRSEGLADAQTMDDIKDGEYQTVTVELAILDNVKQ